ncbi:MAG: hypothetical protein J2P25_14430 [Nocardiopsaceae bacterium]|nr:hypothetical protein [Nocardiopsaceae bacterium]
MTDIIPFTFPETGQPVRTVTNAPISESMDKALQSVEAVEVTMARVRKVAVRLTAGADSLPALLDVRVEASSARGFVALQPRTAEDVRLWADALGVDVTVSEETEDDGGHGVRALAEWSVDSVQVRLGSCEWFSPAEWAARTAEAAA